LSKENGVKKVYLYILGSKNKEDRIDTAVPYRINNDTLFFGPCKKDIRKEIKEDFLKNKEYFDLKSTAIEIYLVGINPSKIKNAPRKLLFAGKIKEIFTFKKAWEYFNERINNVNDLDNSNIKKMINHKSSPLHLKPISNGYEHVSEEHEKSWIGDLSSFSFSNEEKEEIYKRKYIERFYRGKEIPFDRDCCFLLENLFFSIKGETYVQMDDELINFIKKRLELNHTKRVSEHNGPDISSPFGYCINKKKYGRGFTLQFENENAITFISLIQKKIKDTSR